MVKYNVGDFTEQIVSVHNADDFNKLREIYVSFRPNNITVDTQGNICVIHTNLLPHNSRYCRVTVFDDCGDEIYTIFPTICNKKAVPLGAVFDLNNTLLVAVFDWTIKKGGHVHRYNKKGEFLECVIKGTEKPYGIRLGNSYLGIADDKSVIVYKPKY